MIRDEVEKMATSWAKLNEFQGKKSLVGWMERLVLAQGQVMIPCPKAKLHGSKQPKLCFENSIKYACRRGLRYVEGYATRPEGLGGFLIHHAWVETKDGKVLDLTWRDVIKDQCEYVGIAFDAQEAMAVMKKTRFYGVLDIGFKPCREFLEAKFPGCLEK